MSDMFGDITEELAPGVRGYTVEHEGALYVPLLIAEKPGNGDVGRYLDSLPRDRTVKVPGVLSARLQGMLERRGFVATSEYVEDMGEHIDVYMREAP